MPATPEQLRADVDRLERVIDGKVSRELYQSEMKTLREDVANMETRYQEILRSQLQTRLMVIFQLLGFLVAIVLVVIQNLS